MDARVAQWVTDHRVWVANDIALLLMHVGQSAVTVVVLLTAMVGAAVRRRQWAWAASVCTATVLGAVVSVGAKAIVERPRPPAGEALVVAGGWSMPSSASLLSAAVAVAAVWGWERPSPRGQRIAMIVAAVVVAILGLAVVYLGVHWASDVLVGWALGASVGAASVWIGRHIAGGLRRLVPRVFDWVEKFSA